MARILYGVQADGTGHINRARIVAEAMPHHDFLFVGGGRVSELAKEGHLFEPVPFLDTIYRDNRIDVRRTATHGIGVLCRVHKVVERLSQVIGDFDPALIVTDYEFFTPLAARKLDRFCVSLDHQHVLTRCSYDRPRGQFLGRIMGNSVMRFMFSFASHYIITSFFRPPPLDPGNTEIFPPMVKRTIIEQTPSEGEHVVVYQTSETFEQLLPVLETIGSPVMIYGFGKRPARKNLVFKERDKESFVGDLASSLYVVANGGHNVISEALFLGKPVLSFPIANHYEQFTNAYFLDKLGYGSYVIGRHPSADLFKRFQSRMEEYKARIRTQASCGNQGIFQRLEELIANGMPSSRDGAARN